MEGYVDSQNSDTKEDSQPNLVAEALAGYKADENGKVIIPEDTPAYVAEALKIEQRRRNSNSEYSKERSRREKAEAEIEALKGQMASLAKPSGLTREQQEELDDLKFTDPDAWFEKKQALSRQMENQVNDTVTQAYERASQDANDKYNNNVKERREKSLNDLLAEHNQANPDKPLNMDMLSLNVPPILIENYHSGNVDEVGFLNSVSKFLYADKTIKTEKVSTQPNLSNAVGSSSPSDNAMNQSLEQIYSGI